jgi:Domain of unknown function (DUF4159)
MIAPMQQRKHKVLWSVCVTLGLLAGVAVAGTAMRSANTRTDLPEAEFHLARLIYRTRGGGGSHGLFEPWWAIDYPFAEEHFLPALRRMTQMSVADDSRHLDLMDDRIFDYPFLLMQQPGRGYWNPTEEEAARLREYLLRGGFLLVDDFHGDYDWAVFQNAIRRVFPDRPIVEIPENDSVMHVFFDIDQRTQIPGKRHLRYGSGGQVVVRMDGEPHWRGIYDDRGNLMVAMNFNMDMGDAWEHADDPDYPGPMTAFAYQLGVNYVIYAMTH